MIEYADHPSLWPAAFVARFDAPLRHLEAPLSVQAALSKGSAAGEALSKSAAGPGSDLGIGTIDPDTREALRRDTRSLLRHGGYKPSGRGKPSAEYLARANLESDLPSINVAVDTCNALSLHSALPISVVDLDLLLPPLRVATVEHGSYVFNSSGQEIQLDGLLCLMDATGPRANAVKDCHETKTHGETDAILSVVWGSNQHADHCERVLEAFMALMAGAGAAVERVGPRRTGVAPTD